MYKDNRMANQSAFSINADLNKSPSNKDVKQGLWYQVKSTNTISGNKMVGRFLPVIRSGSKIDCDTKRVYNISQLYSEE